MQFYPKDKDPRLDNRVAQANGRRIKVGLLNSDLVSSYYGVDIERANNHVTWDYDKDKWCSRDEMMGSCHIIVHKLEVRDKNDNASHIAENKLDKELAIICQDIYKKAQIHSMVSWENPVEKLGKGTMVYHVRWWVMEMGDSTDKVVYDKGIKHRFFDMNDQSLLEVA